MMLLVHHANAFGQESPKPAVSVNYCRERATDRSSLSTNEP